MALPAYQRITNSTFVRGLFCLVLCIPLLQGDSPPTHVTDGCGCTTTTTCIPSSESHGPCFSGITGKHGPVGPKGEKGEPAIQDRDLQQSYLTLQNKYKVLENVLDDLKFHFDLHNTFPSSCSEYIRHETTMRKFEQVPIYPRNLEGKTTIVVANCTRLADLRNPKTSGVLPIPYNSIQGRTFVLNGIRRQRGNANRINVVFGASEPKIFFIIDIVEDIVKVADRVKTSWNTWERPFPRSSPFTVDAPFSMKVTVDEIGYNCFLDGRKLFTFRHRQFPLSELESIKVTGNIDITFMSFN